MCVSVRAVPSTKMRRSFPERPLTRRKAPGGRFPRIVRARTEAMQGRASRLKDASSSGACGPMTRKSCGSAPTMAGRLEARTVGASGASSVATSSRSLPFSRAKGNPCQQVRRPSSPPPPNLSRERTLQHLQLAFRSRTADFPYACTGTPIRWWRQGARDGAEAVARKKERLFFTFTQVSQSSAGRDARTGLGLARNTSAFELPSASSARPPCADGNEIPALDWWGRDVIFSAYTCAKLEEIGRGEVPCSRTSATQ